MIAEIIGAGVAALAMFGVLTHKQEKMRRAQECEKNLQAWRCINASLWWKDGIPNNKSLIIDSSVLMADTMQMSFWFRMVLVQARNNGWKVLIPSIAYDEIAGMSKSNRRVQIAKAKHRVSRFQDVMGKDFQFLGKIQSERTVGNSDKEIIHYMLSEEGKDAILFSFDRDLKVRLTEMARKKSIPIEKVRTSDNLLSHCDAEGRNMYNSWEGDIEDLPANAAVAYGYPSQYRQDAFMDDVIGSEYFFECIGIDLVKGECKD